MAVNTHGLKINGLRKVAGETKSLNGPYDSSYLELFYDRKAHKAWTVYQCSIGQNSWTVYRDDSIVKICNLSVPHTMQELADMIADAVAAMTDCRPEENV